MKVLLVRHGETKSNREKRFIGGATDEPISEQGKRELEGRRYPSPEHVFSSPMCRCLQTANVIFGTETPEIIEGFRECDFGIIEGKTHEELAGYARYDAFVESGGGLPFPEGESIEGFCARSQKAFEDVVNECIDKRYDFIACTVHGGTIMGILSWMFPETEMYRWNVKNGEGYLIEIEEEAWNAGCRTGVVLRGIEEHIYT